MSSLSEAAGKRLRSVNRRQELPSWWTLGQIVVGVIFFCALAYSFMTDENTPPVELPDDPFAAPAETPVVDPGTVATVPAPVEPTAPISPGPTAPTTTGTVTLPAADGTLVEVPVAAVDLAKAAAVANFTGNYVDVPVAAGVTRTPPLRLWLDAVAADVTVLTAVEGEFALNVTVDPDATGPETARPIVIPVTVEDGSWVYAP